MEGLLPKILMPMIVIQPRVQAAVLIVSTPTHDADFNLVDSRKFFRFLITKRVHPQHSPKQALTMSLLIACLLLLIPSIPLIIMTWKLMKLV